MEKDEIRVIIADDEPITRMDLKELLAEEGYTVLSEVSDGFDAVETCKLFHPNLVLLDIKMPFLDGLSAAKIIYVCNIMTKHGETDSFAVEDFVRVLEQYLGEGAIDYLLVNNGELRSSLVKKYEEEGKIPVRLRDRQLLMRKGIKIVERDFTSETDYIRHDPHKLSRTIEDFASGWIR